ncbi:gluconate 2-dehydrogenase subunit 3 family protein [Rheinheimera sp.]|uniref:gluconate 2-dehydrogenase subunit 3 family protein n=1 Tax=Rheinheimera sp. TaxID=1869214 RepID=UPI00307F0A32
MDRRDLLKMIAAATGMAMVGGDVWAAGQKSPDAGKTLYTADDVAMLDEIAETILPQTSSPGGKAAACGAMMAVLVNDCYSLEHQTLFFAGLKQIKSLSKQQFKQDFMALTPEQKLELLSKLDAEAKQGGTSGLGGSSSLASSKTSERKGELHYFTLLKQLSLFTFFTSQVGGTEALRYVAVPGKYDGDLPYKKGDKAWAT